MTSTMLRMQHTSLQYSDSPAQQRQDINDLFEQGKDFPIKTGTEGASDKGSDNMNHPFLLEFAKQYNHAIHIVRDNWVAIDRAIIEPKSLSKGELFLISNDNMVGNGHDRVLSFMEFDHIDERVGHLSVGAIHYATKSRGPSWPNWDINEVCAKKLSGWMAKEGAGKNLAFLNGDFNMSDKDPKQDWAFGGNFTSMADELKAWQNTGHGPIDGFCSYDRDARVKAKRFNVLDDKEMFQHSDHFVCRGTWEIQHLKTA